MKFFTPRGYVVKTGEGYAGFATSSATNTLWLDEVTVFDTREEAARAIRRTLAYEKVLGYRWVWLESASIEKVEP